MNCTSAIASSTSFRKIWPTPARRSGLDAQKSASQRLCAWMPACRSSYSSADGGRAITAPVGKNGGTVFGKSTSAAVPSDSCSLTATFVVPVLVALLAVEITERVLVAVPPRVELVAVGGIEVLAVLLVVATGVRVGRDQEVAVDDVAVLMTSRLNTRSAFSRRNFGHTWSRNGTSGISVKIRSRLSPIG